MTSNAEICVNQRKQYTEDGYVVVPNLFTREEVQEWKQRLKERLQEENALNEPSGVRVWFLNQESLSGNDNITTNNREKNKHINRGGNKKKGMDETTCSNVQDPRLVQVLQTLLGPDIEFLSVKAVFKNTTTRFASPWHQDWHYWHGSPKCSVWIALDDATPENGCLRLVPGSHKRGPIRMANIEDTNGQGFVHRLKGDSDLDSILGSNVTKLMVPIEAGGAIFFHDLTLHASCPNSNGQDRWTTIATYRVGQEIDTSTTWQQSLVLSGTSVNNSV